MSLKPNSLLLRPLIAALILAAALLFLLRTSTDRGGGASPSLLRIRPGFTSYDDYLKLQLNKMLNPRLRRILATRDWDRKVRVFSRFFSDLKSQGLLSNTSRALCVGPRLGQEVSALRAVGMREAVGMDLVPSPPLVVEGDFHRHSFGVDGVCTL